MPMIIGIPYKYFKGFINCYIGSNHDEDNGRRIYLVFDSDYLHSEHKDIPKGRLKILETNSQYVRSIEIDRFTMLVYKPLEIFEIDFDIFKSGKYSKFSKKYKSILKGIYKNKRISSIIDPSEKDRAELASKLFDENDQDRLPDNCEIFSTIDDIEETFSIAAFLEVDS